MATNIQKQVGAQDDWYFFPSNESIFLLLLAATSIQYRGYTPAGILQLPLFPCLI